MNYLSVKLSILGFLGLCFLGTTACIYEPEQFEDKSENTNTGSVSESKIGKVYAINGQKQICNPSVSQDTINYPESMLWLGFSGKLNVIPLDSSYNISGVYQHDRLTITNKDNEVTWYLMVEDGECQFQDPEWSTHPDYLVALRAYDLDEKKSCDNMDYGIFAVRVIDKKRFWFLKKDIGEFASPHLWVDSSAKVDSTAGDSTMEGFFGTNQVRLVYVDPKNDINFVDFGNGGLKNKIVLKKTAEMTDLIVDSPMISPDGNFIVFNVMRGSSVVKSYVQKLSANSSPVEIVKSSDMAGVPAQPHWFKYGEKLFILWAEIPGGTLYIKSDLTKADAQDGSVGRTVMQEVFLDANAPADLSVLWVGPVIEIASVPTTGGRSPDGRFLATGYQFGFMLELP